MKKAMIFAAGLGTRLAPLTNDRPKALVTLKAQPLLWHVINNLVDEGFTHITVNVHHFAQMIISYLHSGPMCRYAASRGVVIGISDESAQLLDTGGGLRKAGPILFANDNEPVLIHNVDIISNAKLSKVYDSVNDADALLLVSERASSRYLLFDDELNMVGWQNVATGEVRTPYPNLDVAACRRFAFSGIHVVTKRLVDAMAPWPDEFGIIDYYIQSCKHLNIKGYVDNNLCLTDVGKIEVLRQLEAQNP